MNYKKKIKQELKAMTNEQWFKDFDEDFKEECIEGVKEQYAPYSNVQQALLNGMAGGCYGGRDNKKDTGWKEIEDNMGYEKHDKYAYYRLKMQYVCYKQFNKLSFFYKRYNKDKNFTALR